VTESKREVFNTAWCVYASQIGLTDMFTPQANLLRISQQPLLVSEVVQKAHIEVDEEGATAAAATGIDYSLLYLEFL
jgi:serine protease inhibitor